MSLDRRRFIGGAAAAVATGCVSSNPAAKAAADAAALAASRRWFREAQFGMMAHWGLYTLLGGEWKGKPGLISGRIGNGLGDYETPNDNVIAEKTESGRLYETVGTMNDSWGCRPTDTRYKSVEKILEIKSKCAAIGSNYMLNVGPDPLGRLPVAAINILDGLAKS